MELNVGETISVKDLPLNISSNNTSTFKERKPNQITGSTSFKQQSENQSAMKRRGGNKDKVEAIKARIKLLFLNYCDYSIENGNIFITYTNFMKLIRDA